MKAINMLDNEEYEVHTYHDIMYLKRGGTLPYYILDEPVDINTVEDGFMYCTYKIDEHYYQGYYTNSLDQFNKQIEQLSLFNRLDYF